MTTTPPRTTATAPGHHGADDLAEFDDLVSGLDHALAGPAGVAPPPVFMQRVGARRRERIRARAATALTFVIAIAAALFTLYTNQPVTPSGPLANRSAPRQIDPDNTGAVLLVGSRGPGLHPAPRNPDLTPRGHGAAPIRLGDGLETEAVRALLAT